jgi:hypothetical protein
MAKASDTIIVAGSGRSGTTWLGNVIAGDDLRIIFEPFDERRVPELAGLGLRPYFRQNEPYTQWRKPVSKILAGEVRNEWTDQDLHRFDKVKEPKGVVIKDIRANGMLAWLSRNYPCRVLYLLRHPCAVIASRMKLRWETHLDVFLDQPELMQDHLAPYADAILGAETEAQKHAVMWCVENLIPLRQLADSNWIFCTYEKLCAEPRKETERILRDFGLDLTGARLEALNEHSRTCSGRAPETTVNFLADWQDSLPADARRDIAATLDRFGIDLYDVNELMPLR